MSRYANVDSTGVPAIITQSSRVNRLSRKPEVKYVDTIGSLTCSQPTPVELPLNLPAQALTEFGRIGSQIDCVAIEGNIDFSYTSGTAAPVAHATQIYLWTVFRYLKTVTGSFAAPPGVGQFYNLDLTTNYTPLSLRNQDHVEDYDILAAGQIELDMPSWNSGGNTEHIKTLNFKHICNFPIDFENAAGANVVDNMVMLQIVAQNPANTGGTSTIQYGLRLMYTDC